MTLSSVPHTLPLPLVPTGDFCSFLSNPGSAVNLHSLPNCNSNCRYLTVGIYCGICCFEVHCSSIYIKPLTNCWHLYILPVLQLLPVIAFDFLYHVEFVKEAIWQRHLFLSAKKSTMYQAWQWQIYLHCKLNSIYLLSIIIAWSLYFCTNTSHKEQVTLSMYTKLKSFKHNITVMQHNTHRVYP